MAPLPPLLKSYTCANCQTEQQGNFCAECGQEKLAGDDLKLKKVWRHILDQILEFDLKWLCSVWTLLRKPGQLTLDFIQGRRVRYVHPLGLFLCIGGLYVAFAPSFHPLLAAPTIAWMTVDNVMHDLLSGRERKRWDEGREKRNQFPWMLKAGAAGRESIGRVTAIKAAIVAGSVLSGACLCILFATRRPFLAEHFVMGLHLGCWNLFATAVVGLLVTFLPEGYAIPIPIAAILLLDMIYFVIAATRVYGQGSFVLIWKWLILQAVMLFYFVVAGIVLAIMAFSQ